MSNKTTNETAEILPESREEGECNRLLVFKKFLREIASSDGNNEIRNLVTRSSNETYPVSRAELCAEIIMTIWNQLQMKRCPRAFQLAIVRAVLSEVEKECLNAKECDFTYAGSRKVGSEEAEVLETYFDLAKLQKFVINNLEKLLTRLTDNAEMGNLKNYADEGSLCGGEKCNCSTESESLSSYSYVAGHIKNKPRKMEDRHVCLERFSDLYRLNKAYSFYGVFDGHSGPLAASYATSQLPYLLAEHLMKSNETDKNDSLIYREAFECSFMEADKMFIQKNISSGTTAVCVLISHQTPAHLYAAWVGDSKALLVSPTVSLQLVKPHKPDAPDERKRIETSDTGGTVMFVQGHWRVNGILNVSRSIGDYSVNAVIAEPDFVDVQLTASHDFIVMGTDGLFDHVPESKITETVYKAIQDAEQKLEDIPKRLIELAKEGDSQDNITVVIVFFKERINIVDNFKKATG